MGGDWKQGILLRALLPPLNFDTFFISQFLTVIQSDLYKSEF